MTDNEILREYRTAKNPKNQIKIMAQLYPSIGERGIYDALIRCGEKIKIPHRLLTEEEKMEEELKINEVTAEEKLDKRSQPWSAEKRAAIMAGREKSKAKTGGVASKEAKEDVKDWKPISFDKPTEKLPAELEYVIVEGLRAIINEAKQKMDEARALMDKYAEAMACAKKLGIIVDEQEVQH